jgi:FkbM family methyltransferase
VVNGLLWAASHAYRQKIVKPRRARAWERLTEPVDHSVRNLTFRLYPGEYVDRHIFVEGIYERRFLDLVRSHFLKHPGSAMLDIGANIGNHALYLSDCFREVHCFEPNPTVIRMLEDNIRLSRLDNITVHPVGLGNKSGEMPFLENHDGNLGNSGFIQTANEDTVMLPIEVGDDYVSRLNLPKIDFIKVDVEDHEPEVFEGLRKTISAHRPMIAFEYHGQRVGHFDRIAACLPGYVFVEPVYSPQHASKLVKLRWHLKNQGRPTLKEITGEPEKRTYENIIALPRLMNRMPCIQRTGHG